MRIFNGISGISLQSTKALSDAFKKKGHKSKIIIYRENRLLQNLEDENINIDTKNFLLYPIYILRVLKTFLKSIKDFDVFHFHSGHSFFPRNLDLLLLKLLKKKVFMEYHGSEIRRETVFADKNTHGIDIGCITDNQSYKLQKRIVKHTNGVIVHDKELEEQLFRFNKNIFTLPLRMDLDKIKPNYSLNEDKLTIVHAPSRRGKKGTEFILDAISSLQKIYDLELILIENKSYKEALKIYEKADLIIDQLLIGTYGVFSIEAMAMGKPVITYIRKDLLNSFPKDLPIYNSNIYDIKNDIEYLIKNPKLRHDIGLKSRKYVETYHDSNNIAAKALKIYSDG